MTYTLYDLVLAVAPLVANYVEGTATGGSTTTTIDTVDRTEDDDYWNGGTLFVVQTTDGLAPQGEYKRITDFVKSTAVITAGTLTAAVGAGDFYAIIDDEYPLNLIIAGVNDALRRLGRVPVFDTTSLTIASGQTEYDLPVAAKTDLRQVFIQTQDDSNDNRWKEIFNWYSRPSTAGTVGKLILNKQFTSGDKLALYYMASHDLMRDYTDKLNDEVPLERVIYRAAEEVLIRKRRATRKKDYDFDIDRMMKIADKMEMEIQIPMPQLPGTLTIVGSGDYLYPGDRTPRNG